MTTAAETAARVVTPERVLQVGLGFWASKTLEGQQYSAQELTDMLADAGFRGIRIMPACAPYSMVEGRKP